MTKKQKFKYSIRSLAAILVVIVLVGFSVFYYFFAINPDMNYQAAAKKCGEQPYVAIDKEYYAPPDKQDTFSNNDNYDELVRKIGAKFYCSDKDAESAGYKSWTNPDCIGVFAC